MTQTQPAPSLLNRPNAQPLVLTLKTPVHFIGIGGVGMSALATVLLAQGFQVSGSDAKESPALEKLRRLGGTVYASHGAEQVPKNAIIVASSAISVDNPEAQQAIQHQSPIFHRSDLLRELLKRFETTIGLTGTHGKTSMTGMTGLVLEAGGLDPTIIAGGLIPGLNANAKAGRNQAFAVAELDESDGTVVQYQPTISVIANLELDHPDHYQDGLEAIKQTFRTFLNGLNASHIVLFNMNCPVVAELFAAYQHHVTAIAVYPDEAPAGSVIETAYTIQNAVIHPEGGYQAEVYQGQALLGTLWLQVPGRHNLANALFAAIIGHRLGITFDVIRRALENFAGMGRRFEQLGKVNDARVIDDYAHHPTEVAATLKAAQEFNKSAGGRVIAMFQPHRYHRLATLWPEFLTSFADADEVIVLDVYAAGETPIPGISSERFAAELAHPAAEYWPSTDPELIQARLKAILTPGDLLLTLGAGDITHIGRRLVGL